MKIAISSKTKSIKGEISDVFGRCPYFVIVEIKGNEMKEIEVIENKSIDQAGGAGVSTSQLVAEKGVEAVITGNVGPRALDIFKQFNIKVYLGKGKIEEEVRKLMEGKLEVGEGDKGCEDCPHNPEKK